MTFQRYWRAFFVERAAQSLSGEVTCMSGPWVFMRNEALADILDEWYFQEFLGVRSTYGDDRHLTTLFLRNGWDTLFTPDSAVLTDCPTDWKTFLKQQLRWNKSFNRENLQLFRFIYKMDKYVQFDTAFQQLFAFAMLSIFVSVTGNAVKTGFEQGAIEGLNTVVPYAVTVLFYNELFIGVYGALKNKDAKYLMSPTYIAYHFGGLLWLKIYALFKMKDASWGTKGELNDAQTKQLMSTFEAEKGRLVEELASEIERKHAANPEQYSQDVGLDEMTVEEAAAFGHQMLDVDIPTNDDDDYGYDQMDGMDNN
jgi:hyaluronan synthase